MSLFTKVSFATLCLLPAVPASAQAEIAPKPTPTVNLVAAPPILATLKASHPRLLATETSWDQIKARRAQDPVLYALLNRSEVEARAILGVEPIAYKMSGKRLLPVARTILRRVILLAMQFRLTGDEAFSKRAQAEMLNAAAFQDWNPSHFLDTGEMTVGLALGYDWLYDQLDDQTRQTIATAIADKGLRAGLKNTGSLKRYDNWNSVGNAGMALGALAIAEEHPLLAAQTLQNVRAFNPNGMKVYAPAGVYPEGPGYWNYGTTFQVILLGALESALGTDWGLSQSPGFLQTADTMFHLMGPTGTFFNYFDGGARPFWEGATFWFAKKLNRPELLHFEMAHVKGYTSRRVLPLSDFDRTLPLVALWWPNEQTKKNSDLPTNWYGPGPNPIATFRSSWEDPNAMFLALKGGRASQGHGHMDAGSFVFESDGVRWARDLDAQNYLPLEQIGIDLWNSKQDGGRWSVFRLNNFSHNTLTINNQLHRADGDAKITHFSGGKDAGAIVDLSPVFAGQASRVTRGFSFQSPRNVLIRDEIEGLKAGDTVRWAMVTSAKIAIENDGSSATLTQGDKKLHLGLRSPHATKFEIVSAEPKTDYDQPNPGVQLLVANFMAPASGRLDWTVSLQPGSAPNTTEDALASTSLPLWPQKPTS